MACAHSKTNVADGTCAPITAGTDPGDECEPVGTGECQTPGTCNGKGACATRAGVTCGGPGTCTSETNLQSGHACDATGNCVAQPNTDCAPYRCVSGACLTQCSTEADCASDKVCVKGTCTDASKDGFACKNAAECASGYCVEGVCCESACDEACHSCVANKTGGVEGKCLPVLAGGHDPKGTCQISNPPCGPDDTCDGKGHCSQFAPKGKACGTACQGNSQVNQKCDGFGVCKSDLSTASACTPYACVDSAGACMTTCTADTDCASGAKCDVQSGQCAFNNATCADEYTLKDGDGTEHDCTPYKCMGTTCLSACTAPTDCAPGYDCTESRCVKKSAGGGTGGGATGDGGPAGPEQTDVTQDNGCGCSVPGGNPGKNKPWAALGLALAALGLARRRR